MKRTILSLLCVSTLACSALAADDKKATPAPADNSARNEADRSGKTKTSGDQSNSNADVQTTAAIRRAVVGDGSLSTTAKNVKIITENGVVTLRGPVLSATEKAAIAKHAKAAGGKVKIVDQLEVKKAAK